ncbi:hypothetical protein Tco_1114017, partial [Tanacetum coccineum]
DENPIRTLGDYSKPSHEGYKNTIELPKGNNVVPLQFDTIRLVQNGCSFHGLWSEDPNQHLKDFLKLVDSLGLNGDNRERTRLRLFQFSLRDQESQDARLYKFEADFKQQQGKMTNKIDTVLKAITDRITGELPSDTVKNSKLNVNSTTPVLSARSYPTDDPKGEEREKRNNPENLDTTPPSPPDPSISFITEKVRKLNSFLESSGVVPQSSDTEFVCTKGDDEDVMFIEIIRNYDDSHKKDLKMRGMRQLKG